MECEFRRMNVNNEEHVFEKLKKIRKEKIGGSTGLEEECFSTFMFESIEFCNIFF